MGGSGSAAASMRQEQQRQEFLQNEGLRQIQAIFEGGTYTPYTRFTGTPTPGQTYYVLNANTGKYEPYVPQTKPVSLTGGGPANVGRLESRTAPFVKGGKFTQTMPDLYTAGAPQTYTGFTKPFFDQRTQEYENALMPSMAEQYRKTMSQVVGGYGNKGLTRSSAMQDALASLNREKTRQQVNIANAALGSTQQLQKDIGQERATITSQLMQSSNPSLAAQQSLAAATQFAAPSPLPAAGSFFTNWTNMFLGDQLARQYTNYNNQLMSQFPQGGASSLGTTGTITR